jgi:hypothetical protein
VARDGRRMHGLMYGHELESLDGTEVVSRVNQAAAFRRISRSARDPRGTGGEARPTPPWSAWPIVTVGLAGR